MTKTHTYATTRSNFFKEEYLIYSITDSCIEIRLNCNFASLKCFRVETSHLPLATLALKFNHEGPFY